MALPIPRPGLVIRYSYLWHREFAAGREEGSKDRPCAIIAAMAVDAAGDTRVLVLPITHRKPDDFEFAVELPAPTKTRLGLDSAPSWVVLTEWNEFIWPGPDVRPQGPLAYGMLPPRLFETIRASFVANVKGQKVRRVRRSE